MKWVDTEKQIQEAKLEKFKYALDKSKHFFNSLKSCYIKIIKIVDFEVSDYVSQYLSENWVPQSFDLPKRVSLGFKQRDTFNIKGRSINFSLDVNNESINIHYGTTSDLHPSQSLPIKDINSVSEDVMLMWFGWIANKQKLDFDMISARLNIKPSPRQVYENLGFNIGDNISDAILLYEEQMDEQRLSMEEKRLAYEKNLEDAKERNKREKRSRLLRPWIRWGIAILIIYVLTRIGFIEWY
jgi:hypothetical protein